ncbi:phage head closure protein [Salmonella enterica]|uniref:phage head closure protein n=1 Tax=Salmonella enterica TaxID=28901 RepID=UPI003AAC0F9B|nr:phage head closure protein [Salmonella enterica subsp. enterica serovar Ituri]
MEAGKLRDRIQLFRPVSKQNSIGELVGSFEPVGNPISADVRVVSGREQLKGGAEKTQQIYTIQIRYYAALRSAWRLRIETGVTAGEVLEINTLQPDNKRRWITIAGTSL